VTQRSLSPRRNRSGCLAEPKSCGDAYSVELWIDDAGRIDAVDLALIPRKGPLPKP